MSALRPLPLDAIALRDGLLAKSVRTVVDVTLPHVVERCEATGRLRNFDRAAGVRTDAYEGRFYDDSDVYKTLEGLGAALHRPVALGSSTAAWLEARHRDWTARIAAAAAEDGYLNTWHQTHPEAPRYADIRWKHELYCTGHLLEAALAAPAERAPSLVATAWRACRHAARHFHAQGLFEPPGHPEIELALLRLAARDGHAGALALARRLLEARGRGEGRERFGELCQDHQPLREQREIRGHAVRATYLLAAVTDLVHQTGDRSWEPALDALWLDLVERKMYVTGGLGSSAANEGFTDPFDLPHEEAYAETCASIGLVFWASRFARLRENAAFVDVAERALFNGVLAGLSLSGDRFFYVNPLASAGTHERKPFFDTACCPTNLARFLPSVGAVLQSQRPGTLVLDVYADGETRLDPAGDALVQRTAYPHDGHVHLRWRLRRPRDVALWLRVPSWCRTPSVRVNDRPLPLRIDRGYAVAARVWNPDDEVLLDLPMRPERIAPDERVRAQRGRVALRRGPLIYAVEGVDHGGDVRDLVLPAGAPLHDAERDPALGGAPVIRAEAVRADGTPAALRAIPYHAWANRGATPMAVWIPATREGVAATPP